MVPKSVKGKIFSILTFVNLGLASFFAANEFYDQSVLSGITSFLCFGVWVAEIYKE